MNRLRPTAAPAIAPSATTVGPDTASWPGERRVSSGHRTLASNGASPAYNSRTRGTPDGRRGRRGASTGGGMLSNIPPFVLWGVAGLGLYFLAKKVL